MPLSDFDVAGGSVFSHALSVFVFFSCLLRDRSTLALMLVLIALVSYPQIYKVELKICSHCILVLDLKRNGSKHVVQKCMYRFVPVDHDFTAN